jgi:hypothetical protein
MAGFVDFVAGMKKTSESKNNQDEIKGEGARGTNKEIIRGREKPAAASKTMCHRQFRLTCMNPNKARTPSSAQQALHFLRKSPPVCAATRAFAAASTLKPSEVGKKCRRAALAANASKAEHAATAAGLQTTGEGKMSGRTFGVQSLR